MKRVPLSRGAAPTRRTPLVAKANLTTVKQLKRGEAKPRPRRNTGPSVTIRNAVIERAAGCCERCGQAIRGDYSIHHRKPRGMGGTSDTAANSPANLVLLCGSATSPGGCHTAVEKFRQAAITTGWIVTRTADPAKVPVKFMRGWVILNHDGSATATTRPEEQP